MSPREQRGRWSRRSSGQRPCRSSLSSGRQRRGRVRRRHRPAAAAAATTASARPRLGTYDLVSSSGYTTVIRDSQRGSAGKRYLCQSVFTVSAWVLLFRLAETVGRREAAPQTIRSRPLFFFREGS